MKHRYRISQICNGETPCRCTSSLHAIDAVGRRVSTIRDFEHEGDLFDTDAGTLTGLAYPGREGAFIANDGEVCTLEELVDGTWIQVKTFKTDSFAVYYDRVLEPQLLREEDWYANGRR